MITIFIRGVLSGDEQFKLNIYPNNRLITPIVSSSWADLSGIGTYSGNWIGNVYSDFDGHPLVAGQSYYVTIETNDYTRNADTFYIGVNLDWGSPVNTQVTSGLTGARMRILGTS
jgi:hypothetical protein